MLQVTKVNATFLGEMQKFCKLIFFPKLISLSLPCLFGGSVKKKCEWYLNMKNPCRVLLVIARAMLCMLLMWLLRSELTAYLVQIKRVSIWSIPSFIVSIPSHFIICKLYRLANHCQVLSPHSHHQRQEETAAEQGHRKPNGHSDGCGHGTNPTVGGTRQTALLQLTDAVATHWHTSTNENVT